MTGVGAIDGLDDRYRLLEEVPGGRVSRVWRAWDRVTDGMVAVKSVPADHVHREVTALLAARLPGVLELVDHASRGDTATIVTRWVDGAPFPGAARDPASVASAAAQLLDILDRVHRCGVVHRDLKPTNVLVEPSGNVVILDLGIAAGVGVERHTDEADVSGTLRYVAPEQLMGELDARSDLYAVGVMVYEALVDAQPHDGADFAGNKLLKSAVPVRDRDPSLDPRLAAAVDRLLARRPEDRFPDARAAAAALGADHRGTALPPGRLSQRRLRDALQGPERVGGYLTRAAALAWRIAGGRRSELEAVFAGWERSGVITRDLRLDPARFDAVEQAEEAAAWMRATGDLPLRQRVERALDESLACGRDGRHDRATLLLRAVLAEDPGRDAARRLGSELASHAIALGTPAAAREAAWLLRRWWQADFAPLVVLLDAVDHIRSGQIDRALGDVEPLDVLLAHVLRNQAGRVASLAVHEAVVDRFEAWAEDPLSRSLATNARGLLEYRRGHFAEAARTHAKAESLAPFRTVALAAGLNSAAAWIEAAELDRAKRALGRVLRGAREVRHTGHEAFALVLLGGAAYRAGSPEVDLELVDALAALGMTAHAGLASLTAAAAAWRARDPRAAAIVDRAETLGARSGRRALQTLASALRACLERSDRRGDVVLDGLPDGVAAQVLALHAMATGDEEWRARAAARAPWSTALDSRREVLSPEEVRSGVIA